MPRRRDAPSGQPTEQRPVTAAAKAAMALMPMIKNRDLNLASRARE
jgi:hypothetical protein